MLLQNLYPVKIRAHNFKFRKLISLKWKALVSLSLILLTVNMTFYLFHKHALETAFEKTRMDTYERNNLAIKALLAKSSFQLQQLGQLIPSLFSNQNSLNQYNTKELTSAFGKIWPILQIDLNINYLAFVDDTAQLLSSWGNNDNLFAIDADFQQTIKRVIKTEVPEAIVKCTIACVQLAIVPLFAKNKSVGSILIGQYLADLVLDFNKLANTDIGILISNPNPNSTIKSSIRYLAPWNMTVFAISNAHETENLLQNLAQRFPSITELSQQQIRHNNQTFEIFAEHFNQHYFQGEGYLVTLDNITDQIAEIDHAKSLSLLIGGLGLTISEGVLLLVLWNPLSRLKHTADTLPLLAKEEYTKFRSTLAQTKKSRFANDEIDFLNATSVQLVNQLENLHNQIQENSDKLSKNMLQLKREMDFAHRILDTAQVIILTLNNQGKILLINYHGSHLTGFDPTELINKNFVDVLAHPDYTRHFTKTLRVIAQGKERHYKDETQIKCKNGQLRHVTWLHSHLDSDTQEGPVMLSVGLDITETKLAEQRITWLADHDTLTGLYNRRRFHEIFEATLKMSSRYNHKGALLFLDIDNFKNINDTQGHHAGDIVIKRVANTLKKVLRNTDIVARFGGDEFAIALPEIDKPGAETVAIGINKKLNDLVFPGLNTMNKLSASIGISLYPYHGNTVNELLSNADLAMYRAKQRGRGCWHLFSLAEQAREQIESQILWQQKIEYAIDNNRFILHFQPILNLQDNTIAHYEVLIRMLSYDGKIIYPTPFIEVAEKTGLINDIDHWVLKQTIKELNAISVDQDKVCLALNLSAHAFSDQALLPLLTDLFRYTNIRKENLILEITETAALADFSAACDLIESIKKLGCRFALDDFGVGFSSFYYLQQLPVDYIKIDGAFVKHLSQNKNNQILVKAITDVARGFGKKTIAEYVEDEETLSILKQYHVDYAQGYYIGRPENTIRPKLI